MLLVHFTGYSCFFKNCRAIGPPVSQGDELEGLEEKAVKTGASKLYVEDLVDEMVDDVVISAICEYILYQRVYLCNAKF